MRSPGGKRPPPTATPFRCDARRIRKGTRKAGVEGSFIVAPDDAPAWAQDRAALWNAAEARETRANSVSAREAARQERALLVELRMRVELAREVYSHAREEGADWVTAGLAALRAAAQKHSIDQEHASEHAQEHTTERGSIRERLARILDRESGTRRPGWRRSKGRGTGRTISAPGWRASSDERRSRPSLRRAAQSPGRTRAVSASGCRTCWRTKSRFCARSQVTIRRRPRLRAALKL